MVVRDTVEFVAVDSVAVLLVGVFTELSSVASALEVVASAVDLREVELTSRVLDDRLEALDLVIVL